MKTEKEIQERFKMLGENVEWHVDREEYVQAEAVLNKRKALNWVLEEK